MDSNQINELVAKYNEGLADPSELRLIERWIEEGVIKITDLRELASLDDLVMHSPDPVPSLRLDDQFHSMLSEEKRKLGGSTVVELNWHTLLPRLALAAGLLLAGFFIGFKVRSSGTDAAPRELQALTQQVSEMKEMMMLTLLEKESASDRLKAVSLTEEMDQVSDKVTTALFRTLNGDPNVNVRLAAIEAIRPYTRDNQVRQQLIRSIANQDSPLVQVTLADLMVVIQEKQSVSELKKILENEKTPQDVKKKIRKSIEVLI